MALVSITHPEFEALVEPYRRELQAHCYRMLGTIQDAEDMVQETFLRAWKRRDTYVRDGSLRAWLYRIATNACLDALRARRRRAIPITLGSASSAADPIPPDLLEPIWIEPYPDDLLDCGDETPEQRVLAREKISLAFLASLHLLPPRQRAVLLLSDVLDWSAREIAELLDTTVSAVKSSLHRARSGIAARHELLRSQDTADRAPHVVGLQTLLDEYVRAWEAADVDSLIDLLHDDATFSMPPIPSWYRGRESIRGLTARTVFAGQAAGRWRLLPAAANRQTAFGLYRLGEPPGQYAAYGIQVLTFRGGQIGDIITFRQPALMPRFGLPLALPAPRV